MPLEWHRQNCANSIESLAEKRRQIQRMQYDLERHEADVRFHEQQIAEATKRGLEGFDRDRFLVKRKA